MVKCLNIGKNIGKPIYRSISKNDVQVWTDILNSYGKASTARVNWDKIDALCYGVVLILVVRDSQVGYSGNWVKIPGGIFRKRRISRGLIGRD